MTPLIEMMASTRSDQSWVTNSIPSMIMLLSYLSGLSDSTLIAELRTS